MRPTNDGAPVSARWIRPLPAGSREGSSASSTPQPSSEDLRRLLVEAREARVAELSRLERQLEDRIRARWEEIESEIRRRESRAHEEIASRRREAEAAIRDERERARREGREDGFREGFERGTEEGRRLGLEKGRIDGMREGRQQGRLEEETRIRQEIRGAVEGLEKGLAALDVERRRVTQEALEVTTRLALEIARKVIRREVRDFDDVVLRNVEKAVELTFRRGRVVLELHPQDVETIEGALTRRPRWAEDFDSVELRASSEIERGGCRLLAGAGTVDTTISTQLALIEQAILGDGDSDEEGFDGEVSSAEGAGARTIDRGEEG